MNKKADLRKHSDVNTLVGLSAIFLFIILGKIQQKILQPGQGLGYFNCCANILKLLFHSSHWPHWNKIIDNGHSYYKKLLFHFWDMGRIVTQVSCYWLYGNQEELLCLDTWLMSGCVFVRNTMCAVLQVAAALHQCPLGA